MSWERAKPRAGRLQYAYLYDTARWKRLRRLQLSASPLCEFCLRDGLVTEATICDHVEPHKGDPEKFFAGPLQSLCKPCHDGEKQAREKSGRISGRIGLDGYPIRDCR